MDDFKTILDEVRHSRLQMSEQCGNDSATYIEYLKKFNEKYSAQVEKYRKQHPAEHAEVVLINS